MTLEEVYEVVLDDFNQNSMTLDPKLREARRLSIEGVALVVRSRNNFPVPFPLLLPGETVKTDSP